MIFGSAGGSACVTSCGRNRSGVRACRCSDPASISTRRLSTIRLAAHCAAASSLDATLREGLRTGADREAAGAVGKLVAERALAAGVTQVVFDRGAYIYHGRVKALAEAAREGGLSF